MSLIRKRCQGGFICKFGKKGGIYPLPEAYGLDLATMCSHVPNKGEQMAKYYGYYSNVSWGKRKKGTSFHLTSP